METIPAGILSKAASGGLYPKFRIKVAEYVVMTPLEMEIYAIVSQCMISLVSSV